MLATRTLINSSSRKLNISAVCRRERRAGNRIQSKMFGTVGTSAAGSKLLLGQEFSVFGFCVIIDVINGSQKEPKGPLSKGLGGGAFVRARGVLAVALVEVGCRARRLAVSARLSFWRSFDGALLWGRSARRPNGNPDHKSFPTRG